MFFFPISLFKIDLDSWTVQKGCRCKTRNQISCRVLRRTAVWVQVMAEDIPHVVDCQFEVSCVIIRVADNATTWRWDANFMIELCKKVAVRLIALQLDSTLQLSKAMT